jgi:hypothetical protein
VQPLGLCPNQGWSRHRPNKLANTRQNPAFAQLSIQWIAAALMKRMGTDRFKKILRLLCSLIADFCNKIGTKRTY